MNHQLSLTRLQVELLRRGLPQAYVHRMLAELADHEEDLHGRTPPRPGGDLTVLSAGSPLGTEAELVERTLAEYRRRYFAGRHPVWTFLVSPLPTLLVAWAGYLLIGGALLLANERILSDSLWTLYAFNFVFACGVPLATAAWYARLARKACLAFRWLLTSTAVIATTAYCLKTQIDPPIGGPGTGRYMIGLGIAPAELLHPANWLQPLQALVPCIVLLALAVRSISAERQRQLARA